MPDAPSRLVVHDLHEAFVNHQAAGTRLVTTQPAYWAVWLSDLTRDHDVLVEATADREQLERHAPELLRMVDSIAPGPQLSEGRRENAMAMAFRVDDPRERLRLCVDALNEARTPGALVATASVCMENNDLDAARRDLDEAIGLAPDWAAAHFELGKLWLRRDGMLEASESFRAAARLMPRFASAWSNLGATLGELDRRDEALQAFTQALACDPTSAQTHNNIGVLCRESGQLTESERAFRRVLELAPELAFGYYNLGHTLFLQGRYQAALGAYAEGQARDPERNPVQATRLAMCRLATGDAAGALADLQRATSALPQEYRRQLLADTLSIAWALVTHRPDLAGWQQVHEWLTREQAR
jgi:tetratricopeptide (TPR) repeat protein